MECSARTRLTASTACPAPMTSVVMRSMARPVASGDLPLDDLDCDVRRIGYDIVHSRALLGLGDERLDILFGRVSVDVKGDLDIVVAIAHVAVDAEDAV